MDGFEIHLALLNKRARVIKSPFYLTVINEHPFTVSVDRVALTEYFILIDGPDKSDQIKIKVYKTIVDGKWYDETYSDEAQFNSPEFGIPAINAELKKMIDIHESQHANIGGRI